MFLGPFLHGIRCNYPHEVIFLNINQTNLKTFLCVKCSIEKSIFIGECFVFSE